MSLVTCRSDFGLYAVFDGHNGTAAAAHCRDVFLRLLLEQLPPGLPPLQSDAEVRSERLFGANGCMSLDAPNALRRCSGIVPLGCLP